MDEKYNVHKNVTVLEKAISKLYTQKYKHLDLKATVIDLNCHNYQYHLKMFDVVLMSFIVAYLLLIVFATVYDVTALRKTNKCITSFSLYHNLTELKRKYQQTDFHKLKCIQGIRFYTTVLIIFCHTFCSFSGGFVANTKYFEEIPQNSLRHGLRNLFVFLVQTFFLISAWLLSYHTFHIFEHAERMHFLKYVWLTFGNRYLRIIPPVLLMVSLGSSIWIYGSFHGPVKDIYSDKEYQRCQENWWIIFLFLNNHYQQHDMCYFTTWYLSADTQLYALSIIILIIIFKLKYSNILLLAICVTIGITIPSMVSYLYNLDFIYRITPENSKNNMFRSFEFNATYTSTYSNMATYTLGLLFGYIYYRLENKPFFTNKVKNTTMKQNAIKIYVFLVAYNFVVDHIPRSSVNSDNNF
jgi:peptidoglycan/LPS O-acetylase OafA/YrhL